MTTPDPNADAATRTFSDQPAAPDQARAGANTVTGSYHDATHSGKAVGASQSAADSTPAIEVGTTFGQYRIEGKLGQGGMGAVYKALQVRLGKHVALKVLPPHLTNDPTVLARFDREMKAVGKLEHPHIVRAMDAGEADGTHYLVMEYVEGLDLSQLVRKKGPRPVIEACELIRQAALGLAHAHENGLIHRDIKPSNLLLTKQGKLKILDLGLARLQGSGESDSGEATAGLTLTTNGVSMGTPDYMAPEQWDNTHNVDGRADLYALGCTLFFLLTGRAPYSGQAHASLVAKMKAHVMEPIPALEPARGDAPAELDALYQSLMAKEQDQRIASAAEVAKTLAGIIRALRGGPPSASQTAAAALSTVQTSPGHHDDELQSAMAALSMLPDARPLPRAAKPASQKSNRNALAIAGGLAAVALLAGVIITIRNRDGSTTKIEVPAGASVEVSQDDKPLWNFPTPPIGSAENGTKAATTSSDRPAMPRSATTATNVPQSPGIEAGATRPQNWIVSPRFPPNPHRLATSPDGKWLACSDWHGTIRIYAADSLRLARIWRHSLKGNVELAFSSGGRLASISPQGPRWTDEVLIDNLKTQQTESPDIPANWQARAFAWALDAERLALGSRRGGIGIWDAVDRQWTELSSAHAKSIRQIAFSPDGRRLAALGDDDLVSVTDSRTGERQLQIPYRDSVGDRKQAGGLAWSPDSRFIAVAEATENPRQDAVRIIDAVSGQDLRTFPITFANAPHQPTLPRWLTDRRLAVMAGGVEFQLIDSQSGESLIEKPYSLVPAGVKSVDWHDEDSFFVTLGYSIARVSIVERQVKQESLSQFGHLRGMAWQPSGDRVNVTSHPAVRSVPFDIFAFDLKGQPAWSKSKDNLAFRIAWTPDGKHLIGARDNELRFFDSSGSLEKTLPLSGTYYHDGSVAVAPDGGYIAVRHGAGAKIFSRTGELIAEVPGASAWSPDSRWVATAKKGGIQFWHPNGEPGPEIVNPLLEAGRLEFSPEGSLAAVCRDRRVRVWNEHRQLKWQYDAEGTEAEPISHRYNPIDGKLAVGYRNGSLVLLDKGGNLVTRIASERFSYPALLDWSRDGRYLAGMHEDASLSIWSADGQLQWTGFVLPDGSQASFAADGKLLHGDPRACAEHLAFFITDDQGQQQALSYEAFEKWQATGKGVTQGKSASASTDADPHRAAALAVLEAGGSVSGLSAKGDFTAARVAELPEGPSAIDIVSLAELSGPLDKACAALKALPHLRSFYAHGSKLTDADLMQLAELDMRGIVLAYTPVTDQAVEAIARWQQVTSIDLSRTSVGDRTCQSLGRMAMLQSLQLTGSQITDAGLAELARCPSLSTLIISDCKGITSKGVAAICTVASLRNLQLQSALVGDEVVEPLSTARQLRFIKLDGTKVTDAGARRLQQALPRAYVFHTATRAYPDEQPLIRWAVDQKPAIIGNVLGEAIAPDQQDGLPLDLLHFSDESPASSEAKRLATARCLSSLAWPNLHQADAAAEHLAKIDGLTELTLFRSDLSGTGLARLAPLVSLAHLNLNSCTQLHDAALAQLPELPAIRWLDLTNCPITGLGLEALSRTPKITTLQLQRTMVDSAGLTHLPPLPHLRDLYLMGTKINDDAVAHLSGYPSLRRLNVTSTGMTAQGIARLHEALPLCAILWDGGLVVPTEKPR